ncbi:MAG: TetR/AcrR family transcriptional regulator, partial [Iamia sp.]
MVSAAAAAAAATKGRGRRVGLTRERVLDAAVELIDRDGLGGFSLRRLAGALGVDPMSIYNHVANKDDLLDGVVEQAMSEMTLDHEPNLAWQDQIRSSAAAFRAVAARHPQVAVLMLTRRVLTAVPRRVMRDAVAPALGGGGAPQRKNKNAGTPHPLL